MSATLNASSSSYVLAADIGGTNTRIGLADQNGALYNVLLEPTARGEGSLVLQIKRMAGEVAESMGYRHNLVAAAVAIPCAVTPRSSIIHRSDNLPELNGFPLRERLMSALKVPVVLENDVNVAALGEMWRGAGINVPDFIMLAVGTGVGMGVICNGQLMRGKSGAAGEVAYLPLGSDPFAPNVQEHGALAHSASGQAIAASAADLLPYYPKSNLQQGADAREVIEAAADGDCLGLHLLGREARLLAQALLSVVAVLDPALLLLGGGVGSNPHLLAPVQEELARLMVDAPPVRIAALGNQAGLVGAAEIALSLSRSGGAESLITKSTVTVDRESK